MSMKDQGKRAEKKIVSGSEDVGRTVKRGAVRMGRGIKRGAETVGRDVKKAGQRMTQSTKSKVGTARADHRAKVRARRA
jgi:hypothetical protein